MDKNRSIATCSTWFVVQVTWLDVLYLKQYISRVKKITHRKHLFTYVRKKTHIRAITMYAQHN